MRSPLTALLASDVRWQQALVFNVELLCNSSDVPFAVEVTVYGFFVCVHGLIAEAA